VVAFTAVLMSSIGIYLLSKLKSARAPRNREKVSMYACGEKIRSGRVLINITLYKYLVYFIILDSSVLMMAFASLVTNPASLLPLMIYLSTVLAAVLLLAFGGE